MITLQLLINQWYGKKKEVDVFEKLSNKTIKAINKGCSNKKQILRKR